MTDLNTPVAGPLALVDGPAPDLAPWISTLKPPAAGVAARVLRALGDGMSRDMLLIAESERRADEIARAIDAMSAQDAPRVLVFPPWDCLPYDRSSPSRESMGRRVAVLTALAEPGKRRRLVVTSPEAMMQRTPPKAALKVRFEVAVGERLDREAMERFARLAGYIQDERIDEPGEIAFLGGVIDVFPPAAATPFRIVIEDDGRVTEIKAYDPISQRSLETVGALSLTAASELILDPADPEDAVEPGREHRLAEHYGKAPLSTLFEAMAGAAIMTEAGVAERVDRVAAQIDEAFETRRTFDAADGSRPPQPRCLYLAQAEVAAVLTCANPLSLDGVRPAPALATERSPGPALKRFVQERRAAGRTVVLAGLTHEHRAVARLLKRNGVDAPHAVETWAGAADAPTGAFVSIVADLDGGFEDEDEDRVVLTPTDIVGGRLARAKGSTDDPFGETELRPGDVVIHEDYGLGVLEALETIEADGVGRDVLRLAYHGGATVLAPVEEFGRIWRYGSEPSAVTLDRLNTQGWNKRRAEISVQIDATAAQMVERAQARDAETTSPITPPRTAFARFAARFPFPESVDQLAAIEAVIADLVSGRPMNRLVCGDVGFGKTEVALRGAAAVAFAGRQVLVAAPTTVLARQHYETFRRRFAGTEVVVAHLSRMVDGEEASRVREGLADGSIGVVVGTHALADKAVTFADLAMVVIDEEHRFGAKMKQALAERAPHLLAMSATPIPRTLQSAMISVQDVSIIASPPARRRPIRTFLTDFDEASVRTVLLREKARGGQSFVVSPQIEDLAPLAARLAALVPELKVVVAHGKLAPDAMDEVMTDFADGVGDVLLSTNIIENGLDVPRANTILIWRPDRFGLAQLHQLRGRVGRGRRQGFAYLLSDADTVMAENTRTRLQTLEALDRLGAGFAISVRDLDLRGGGDLIGDEQAGHIRLIGASLYRRLLGRALRTAKGEAAEDLARPTMNLAEAGALPEAYVPDVAVRINLYARIAQLTGAAEVDALHEEIEDRFGPLPEAATTLMTASRLNALAMAAGVTEVICGPKATAIRFTAPEAKRLTARLAPAEHRRWADGRLLIDADGASAHDEAFLESMFEELLAA